MAKPKVNYEFIQKWVEDLETTRAPQAHGALVRSIPKPKRGQSKWGYCCLGRCEIVAGEKPEAIRYDAFLSVETAEFFGGESNPLLRIPPKLRERTNGVAEVPEDEIHASDLNDDYRLTFKEIAQCIRYTWPKAFKGVK